MILLIHPPHNDRSMRREIRRFVPLLLLALSLTASGCSEKPDDGKKKGENAVAASPADDAAVKSATIVMSQRMTGVVLTVRSAADAAAAERSLTEIVDDYIAAVSDKVSDPNLLGQLEKDRGVRQASAELKRALDSLQAHDPEAGALVRAAIVKESGRIYNIGRQGLSDEEIEKMMAPAGGAPAEGRAPDTKAADSGAR
jgi:hypothetical protein